MLGAAEAHSRSISTYYTGSGDRAGSVLIPVNSARLNYTGVVRLRRSTHTHAGGKNQHTFKGVTRLRVIIVFFSITKKQIGFRPRSQI